MAAVHVLEQAVRFAGQPVVLALGVERAGRITAAADLAERRDDGIKAGGLRGHDGAGGGGFANSLRRLLHGLGFRHRVADRTAPPS